MNAYALNLISYSFCLFVWRTGNYGANLMDEFKNNAHVDGICIANTETLSNNADDETYEKTLKSLLQYKSTARVVVCFCEGKTVRGLLKAIRKLDVAGELVLFGRLVFPLFHTQSSFDCFAQEIQH